MGVATDCSTATAEAPGYVAVMRMVGGARNGYCSNDRPRRLLRPRRTVMMPKTIAAVGRGMKKFAMGYVLSAFAAAVAEAEGEALSISVATGVTFAPARTF